MLQEEEEEKGGLDMSFGRQVFEEESPKNNSSSSINLEEADAEVRGMENERLAKSALPSTTEFDDLTMKFEEIDKSIAVIQGKSSGKVIKTAIANVNRLLDEAERDVAN